MQRQLTQQRYVASDMVSIFLSFPFFDRVGHGVLLKTRCASGFDLVFVSFVISLLSMEIIRQSQGCVY